MPSIWVLIVLNSITMKSFPAGRIRPAPRAASAAAAVLLFDLWRFNAHLRSSSVISSVLRIVLLAPHKPKLQCVHACVFMAASG